MVVEIDAPAFIAGVDDQAIAEQFVKFIEKRGVAPRFDRVVQHDVGVAAHQRAGNADDRRDADAAGDQAPGLSRPVDFEQRGRT